MNELGQGLCWSRQASSSVLEILPGDLVQAGCALLDALHELKHRHRIGKVRVQHGLP